MANVRISCPAFCVYDDDEDGHTGDVQIVHGHDGRDVDVHRIWRPREGPRLVLSLSDDRSGAGVDWVELGDDAVAKLAAMLAEAR